MTRTCENPPQDPAVNEIGNISLDRGKRLFVALNGTLAGETERRDKSVQVSLLFLF